MQRLLSVQRTEDDLTLDDTDFSPEQARDLDQRFRLTDEQGEEGSGGGEQESTEEELDQVDLESEEELGGEELGGEPGEDVDAFETRKKYAPRGYQTGPLGKLKQKLKGKSKREKRRDPKGGGGWDVLSEMVGIPAGFEAAYQKGGVHERFSSMFKQLAVGKEWIQQNQLTEAEKLIDGLGIDKLKKPTGVKAMLSPIIAARIAALKAQEKQLRKQIEKRKKLLGTGEIEKPKGAPQPVDLGSGDGLDGEQLGGGF